MKTTAEYVAQYSRPTTEVKALWDVDFDTRLEIAKAGMDAIIAHHGGSNPAYIQEAIDEAAEILDMQPAHQFKPNVILSAARSLIETRGWHQGDFEQAPGRAVCALKAIQIASGRVWYQERDAVTELLNRIAADTGKPYSIPNWNDSRRSVDEVVRLLY